MSKWKSTFILLSHICHVGYIMQLKLHKPQCFPKSRTASIQQNSITIGGATQLMSSELSSARYPQRSAQSRQLAIDQQRKFPWNFSQTRTWYKVLTELLVQSLKKKHFVKPWNRQDRSQNQDRGPQDNEAKYQQGFFPLRRCGCWVKGHGFRHGIQYLPSDLLFCVCDLHQVRKSLPVT